MTWLRGYAWAATRLELNPLMPATYDVISADSHVIEPHDLWQTHVEQEYRSRAPKLVREATTDRLVCSEADLPPVGLLAGCARADDEVRLEGRWEEDVFPGGYDPERRLADLERDGVDAEVLFPTIAMQFYPIDDIGFQWALFRAYNTWLASFVAHNPATFKGVALLSPDDVPVAIKELQRARDIGLSAVMLPLNLGGERSYADGDLDDLWAAAVDAGMPVNLHAATTRDKDKMWNRGTATDGVLQPYEAQRAILDLILNGVFDRFPDLRVVSAESDAGWAGNMLERADFAWKRMHATKKDSQITCANPPSSYFGPNVKATFMRDHTAILSAPIIGVDAMMWGNDFPHHVSTWPESQAILDEHFEGQPSDMRRRVVCDNAKQLYRFGE